MRPTRRMALTARGAAVLATLAVLCTTAAAQFSVPGVTDAINPFPVIGLPLDDTRHDSIDRRLPVRDLPVAIHIEVDADLLYDFQTGQIRMSAQDLLQQAANLIYERAKSPVRIECDSDRTPPAAAQKLAQSCATTLSQYLVTQEKVTNVKFTSVGVSVARPPPPDRSDILAPLPRRQNKIVIDFAKR